MQTVKHRAPQTDRSSLCFSSRGLASLSLRFAQANGAPTPMLCPDHWFAQTIALPRPLVCPNPWGCMGASSKDDLLFYFYPLFFVPIFPLSEAPLFGPALRQKGRLSGNWSACVAQTSCRPAPARRPAGPHALVRGPSDRIGPARVAPLAFRRANDERLCMGAHLHSGAHNGAKICTICHAQPHRHLAQMRAHLSAATCAKGAPSSSDKLRPSSRVHGGANTRPNTQTQTHTWRANQCAPDSQSSSLVMRVDFA